MITLEEWAERTKGWDKRDVKDLIRGEWIWRQGRLTHSTKVDMEAPTRPWMIQWIDYDHYRAVVKAKRMEEYRARNVIQWSKREDRERW